MRRPAFLLAAFAALALALAPALAEARPGSGSSSGSRGSRSFFSPPTTNTAPAPARPLDRTLEAPRPATPGFGQPAARPPIGQPNPAGGFLARSPFMAGLMGGLIGVGLGGLLFGHGLFGGFSGFASFLGLLLQIALIGGLVWFALRLFRGRGAPQPALAGLPRGAMARGAPGGLLPGGAGGGRPSGAIALTPADFEAFERTLKAVNAAWSAQDEGAMRALTTPEMLRYFGEDIGDLARRGLRNETRDVVLEQGDLAEAWAEGSRDYATVAMKFSQIDVTRRISDGSVVEGDPARRVTATELWTFVRTQRGPWLLSAIQQTG